jgi:hypothetical protein
MHQSSSSHFWHPCSHGLAALEKDLQDILWFAVQQIHDTCPNSSTSVPLLLQNLHFIAAYTYNRPHKRCPTQRNTVHIAGHADSVHASGSNQRNI